MASLLARGLRGVGANILGHAISLANSVVLVPVFLASWGGQRYGEWLALSAVIGYLALLDFGIQTYVVNRMCQAYVQGRLWDLHRDLHSSLKAFAGVAVAGVGGLLALVGFVPLDRVLGFHETSRGTAAVTFFLLGINVFLNSIPMGVIGGLYRATGEYPRAQMIGNVFRTLQLIVSVAVVLSHASMAGLALAWVLVNAAVIGFIVTDLRRMRPEIEIFPRSGSLLHGLTLLGPALLFLLISIASTVSAQGTILVVNWFFGGLAVVQFGTTRIMANLIPQSINVVSAALWPELTAIEARGEHSRLARVSQFLVKLNVSVAVVLALLLHYTGAEVYRTWTGRQIPFAPALLDVMLVQVVLFAFWNTAGLPLMASNRQKAYAWWMVGNALLTVVCGVAFARVWGVLGVAAGALLADIACGVLAVPRLVCRMLQATVGTFLREGLLAPVAIGLGIMLGLESVSEILVSPLWRLVGVPMVIATAYPVASYWLSLDAAERHIVRGFPQRMRAALSS